MAIDYGRMRATATRLLTENGKDFMLTRYSGGTTSADGSDAQGAPSDHVITGVTVPWSDSQLNSSTVQADDIQLKIEATKFLPAKGDKVDIDGRLLSVVGIDIKKPADTSLAYFLQLRS